MINCIKQYLFKILRKQKTSSENELFLFTMLLTIGVVGFPLLASFMPFQISIGAYSLLWAGIAGQLLFAFSIFLVQRKKYDAAAILQIGIISGFNIFALWVLGGGYYIILYFFVALLIVLVIPFQKKWIQPIYFLVLIVVSFVTFQWELFRVPTHNFPVDRGQFAYRNFSSSFLSAFFFIILEKIIRSFLLSYHEQQVKELQTQANRDALTGLYNRRYAEACFAEISNGEEANLPHCIAIADIDDFKKINDTYGHDAGDEALRLMSKLMLESIRKSDLLFRWGGEEFLIIISGANLEESFKRLENIRQKIESVPLLYKEKSIPITITAGMAELNPADIQGSIERCDQLLYQGKRNGKNQIVV